MELLQLFSQSKAYQHLIEELKQHRNCQIDGLVGAALSVVVANLFSAKKQHLFLLLPDKEESAYYLNDLEALIGEERVLFFPDSYRRPYQIEDTDNANVLLRAEVLNQLSHSN